MKIDKSLRVPTNILGPPYNFDMKLKHKYYVALLKILDSHNNKIRCKIKEIFSESSDPKDVDFFECLDYYKCQLKVGLAQRATVRQRIRRLKESMRNKNRFKNGNAKFMH